MDKSKVALMPFVFFLFAVPAHAYVGPGAGLSLLGALWALIAAIAAAFVFMFAWPIRRMRRRKREAKAERERERSFDREAAPRTARVTPLRKGADEEEELDRLPTR